MEVTADVPKSFSRQTLPSSFFFRDGLRIVAHCFCLLSFLVGPSSVFPETGSTRCAASCASGITVSAKYYIAVRSGRQLRKGK